MYDVQLTIEALASKKPLTSSLKRCIIIIEVNGYFSKILAIGMVIKMKTGKLFRSIAAAVVAAAMLAGCAKKEEVSLGGESSSVVSTAGSTSTASSTSSSSSSSTSIRTHSSYKLIVPPNADGTGGSTSVTPQSTPEPVQSASQSTPQSSSAVQSTVQSSSATANSSSSSTPTLKPPVSSSGSAVDRHGWLSVDGTDLVDQSGSKMQLYGMSTHGIAWFPDYINYDTFQFLRDDWGANCIRLAMYSGENSGYCTGGNKQWLKGLVNSGVEYATELGMYVIIDWHVLGDRTPLTYKEEAKKFFDEMSSRYADYPNVIYEICNEPNGGTSWSEITTYANEVIPIIRANSPDSVIIVGTPTWSQEVDKPAANPLKFDNVMYALHFYADTHRDGLRNTMENAIRSGAPIFITEFGMCDASGNGVVNESEANKWKELIDEYNLSYMCWNLANKGESSSIIRSGCSKLSGWTDDELSTQGRIIRSWLRNEDD